MKLGRAAMLALVLVLSLGCLASTALCQSASCTDQQAEALDKDLGRLKSWHDLYVAYELYLGCDDGYFAEGFSDFVARTLANHWDELPELEKLTSANLRFRAFVLGHIDATDGVNDLERAADNARNRCPRGAQQLCEAIESAALEARREDANAWYCIGRGGGSAVEIGQANHPPRCDTYRHLVGACYKVHGRYHYASGDGVTSIWIVGTYHLLGVAQIAAHDATVIWMPEKVADLGRWDEKGFSDVYADFLVCPLLKESPGAMGCVCVQSASHLVVQKFFPDTEPEGVKIVRGTYSLKGDPNPQPKHSGR